MGCQCFQSFCKEEKLNQTQNKVSTCKPKKVLQIRNQSTVASFRELEQQKIERNDTPIGQSSKQKLSKEDKCYKDSSSFDFQNSLRSDCIIGEQSFFEKLEHFTQKEQNKTQKGAQF